MKEVNNLQDAVSWFNEKLILDGFEPIIGCTNYQEYKNGDILRVSYIKNGKLIEHTCQIVEK